MNKELFNSNKLMDRFFRKVDNVVWDLMTGKVGIKTAEGVVTVEGTGDEAVPVVNPIEQFGMPVPAFAQNTPFASVNVGDLIYGAKDITGWVVEKKEKSLVLLKPSGTRSTWTPPKVQFFGFDSGVMVLRSLINVLPGGQSGLGNMQSMLMPLMMMGGGSSDLGEIMPMLLFSQMNAGGDPAAAGAGTNNMASVMQMIMMAKMLKGSKGGGFFDNDDR